MRDAGPLVRPKWAKGPATGPDKGCRWPEKRHQRTKTDAGSPSATLDQHFFNGLLKALLDKGLIKADNFRRNGHKLGYLYVLTPEGIKTKLGLARAYLARKEAEYIALKLEIEAMRSELAQQDVQS